MSPYHHLRIVELGFTERTRNGLRRAQIETVGQLVKKTRQDIEAIVNIGQKSVEEIIDKLAERGLHLKKHELLVALSETLTDRGYDFSYPQLERFVFAPSTRKLKGENQE